MTRACMACGVNIADKRADARYCSRRCGKRHLRSLRPGQHAAEETARMAAKRRLLRAGRRCATCDAPLDDVRADSRFCSRKCYRADYYRSNRERYIENTARWAAANPEAVRAFQARRRAAKRITALRFSTDQLRARIAYYGGLCWICRAAPWEHIDHVKPLSKGGPHMLANLRPACARCNSSKKDRWPFIPKAAAA